MIGSNSIHDTSTVYEQFEAERLAQDRDVSGIATRDIDDATARNLVSDLADRDVVIPIPRNRVLIHDPSGSAFDSITQLAVFHQGWTAAKKADEEDE